MYRAIVIVLSVACFIGGMVLKKYGDTESILWVRLAGSGVIVLGAALGGLFFVIGRQKAK